MENQIKDILEMPRCPHLLTLFLTNNDKLRIPDVFFQYMSSLKVLSLSHNEVLFELPSDISRLVSIELLDLSISRIRELPEGLKALVNFKCLNLEYTFDLIKIPGKLISNFSRIHVLRMFGDAIKRFICWGRTHSKGIARFETFRGIELHLANFSCSQKFFDLA